MRIPIWLASIGSVQIITHPKTPSIAIPADTVRVKTFAHVFGHTFKRIICIKDTCQRFIFHFSLCNVFSFFSWDIKRINASVFNLTFFSFFSSMQVTKAYLTLMVRLMILVSGVKHMNLLEAFLKERLLSKQLAEIFAFEVELVKVLE